MNQKKNDVMLMLFLAFFLTLSASGQVKLPKLISDGMVIQRDTEVKIWGWAAGNEMITVHFINSTYHTTADSSGKWNITLSESGAGGPYQMQIIASNRITIKDILIGDVWVCSGQSNIELPIRRVSWVYPDEIERSVNENIRQFYVPRKYHFKEPLEDMQSGSWKAANAGNIYDFSAVAFFFACELYDKYKVPIGLINAGLGGSPAEAWISEEALKEFPQHYLELQKFKDDLLIEQIQELDNTRIRSWYELLGQKDEGYKDPRKTWRDPKLNTSDWKVMKIPGYWTDTPTGQANGVAWYRKKIHVPSSMAGKQAKLILGRIVDADSVFVNGMFVGTTSYQYPPRRYDIPANLLKEGENTIVVRLISTEGKGGFIPDKPYEIVAEDDIIDLKGEWQYRPGAIMEPLKGETFIRWKPAGLYNAMIAPLLNYSIKGIIWYQGESNADRPDEYSRLFPALINNWREKWNDDSLPFLYVQLPNYMKADEQPSESNWALMREAQLKALAVPNTGMAVTIDLGEWNDIHPLNKKDVGYRLALAAQKVAYGNEDMVYSGPIYHDMSIDGSRIILTFTNKGSGLIAKGGGELQKFAIAGVDKQFVWATAIIEDDVVIVWSEKVSSPVAVRYAWADNPEGANLCNREGLPASPFRTDEWTVTAVSSSLETRIAPGYDIATWYQFKKAAITYTFDDLTGKQLSVAVPLFDPFNCKVTLFIVTGWEPDWPGLQNASDNGHEIASHSVSHPRLSELSIEYQETELSQSQNIINSNIRNASCVILAYPYCDVGDIPTIGKYYIAGRICSGSIEPGTPADFYRISSIIAGSQGSVKTASDLNNKVSLAKSSGGWCVFLFHGIDDDGGYSPFQSSELGLHLDYMNSHIADYWIATFGQVVKYIKERDAISLIETVITPDSLQLSVTDNMDDALYNVPVTIRRVLPRAWKNARIYVNNRLIPCNISPAGNVKYVTFEAVPDEGLIYLSNADEKPSAF